jgi:hypothetical protein
MTTTTTMEVYQRGTTLISSHARGSTNKNISFNSSMKTYFIGNPPFTVPHDSEGGFTESILFVFYFKNI